MLETQIPFPGWGDSLEKGMATHCSILDYRISWTEEPCRLQSKGSQRVRHDWATNIFFSSQKFQIFKKVWVLRLLLLTQWETYSRPQISLTSKKNQLKHKTLPEGTLGFLHQPGFNRLLPESKPAFYSRGFLEVFANCSVKDVSEHPNCWGRRW